MTSVSRSEMYLRDRFRATHGVMVCTYVCFPSLPPMLECGFESRMGLEFSGFSVWHLLKLVVRGFLQVLQFLPHHLMVSANKIELK